MAEHHEQVALIRWCQLHKNLIPELDDIFSIPNQRKCSPYQGAKLKAEGLKPGVSDLFLPVPTSSHPGMFLEMKFANNGLSKEQIEFNKKMQARGYRVEVAYSSNEAILLIYDYLKDLYDFKITETPKNFFVPIAILEAKKKPASASVAC